MRRLAINHVFTSVLTVFLISSAVWTKAAPRTEGKNVFQENCAKCHAAGGNVVTPGKPIIGSPKLESFPGFKAYLESPQGHMPYYSHIVKDQTALKALYDYCKTLKPSKQS